MLQIQNARRQGTVNAHRVADARSLNVLVAVDGSDSSRAALRLTRRIAPADGWTLVVCHVVAPTFSTFDGASSITRARITALRSGGEILSEARRVLGGVAGHYELLEGDAVEAICRRADELGCDLVIVGSRGLGVFDRLVTRSVSSAIVGRAACSVLVARLERGRRVGSHVRFVSAAADVIHVSPGRLRPGLQVFVDGDHAGRVKDVEADGFVVDRQFRRDVWIPLERVTAVTDDAVWVLRPNAPGARWRLDEGGSKTDS